MEVIIDAVEYYIVLNDSLFEVWLYEVLKVNSQYITWSRCMGFSLPESPDSSFQRE